MIRYNLDKLGWADFEYLTQSLIKVAYGALIESWGGDKDRGLDAYYKDALQLSGFQQPEPGPFIFQAKFVDSANAAGAKPFPLLKSAVKKEVDRIRERMQSHQWKKPRYYILYTNVSISATERDELNKLIPKDVADDPRFFGGNDLCDLLDQFPNIYRAFPKLWDLRDLDELIFKTLNNEIYERSQGAISCARELLPLFVPTQAYLRTLDTLDEYHFAVLEGPPEMGKTAIAWVVGFQYFMEGWEICVCQGSSDFFRAHTGKRRQIFICDDAFGRTEYDPSLSRDWEHNLHLVLERIDKHHLMIWTCRKHILQRAMKELDTQGKAENFPAPANVLIDASELTLREKCAMLYQHVRAASVAETSKEFIRDNAEKIVMDRNFSPERIRRFVKEFLPILAKQYTGDNAQAVKELSLAISESIRNPTDGMRKSFRALRSAHKWALMAMLDSDPSSKFANYSQLESVYRLHTQDKDHFSFDEVIDELSDAFLKSR